MDQVFFWVSCFSQKPAIYKSYGLLLLLSDNKYTNQGSRENEVAEEYGCKNSGCYERHCGIELLLLCYEEQV